MSTGTLDTGTSVPQFRAVERRVTFAGLLRSEWIKFWSVRSVVVTMIVSFVAVVGLGALLSWAVSTTVGNAEATAEMAASGFDSTAASLQGAQMASLIVAAVGVIVIAGEFSTGMIRTSFVTAPRRLGLLLAKAVVLAVNVAVIMAVGVLLAFLVGQAILDGQGVGASLGDEHVVRVLLGNVLMLAGVAVAGLGVGALLKNSAGAICTVIAALFLVPTLLPLVPESWGGDVLQEYWFANTLANVTSTSAQDAYLSVGAGTAAFLVWIVVLFGLGALAVKRRDV